MDLFRVRLHGRAMEFGFDEFETNGARRAQLEHALYHKLKMSVREIAEQCHGPQAGPECNVSQYYYQDATSSSSKYKYSYASDTSDAAYPAHKNGVFEAASKQLTEVLRMYEDEKRRRVVAEARLYEYQKEVLFATKTVTDLNAEVAALKARIATTPIPAEFGRPANRKLLCA